MSSSPDFLGDKQQYGIISYIKPYLPNLLLGHDVCAVIETLTKTGTIQKGRREACIYQMFIPFQALLLVPRSSWGGKGLFGLHFHTAVHHQGRKSGLELKQVRKQKLMQRQWRDITY